jgi:hypothetical protein
MAWGKGKNFDEMKPSDEIELLVEAVETDPNATHEEIYKMQARWYQALANEGDKRCQEIVERIRVVRPDHLI